MSKRKRTGTREWSEASANCRLGCAHGCLYCYAREQALRFKRIARGEDWVKERPDPKARIPCTRLSKGRVMFPTHHDITPENLGDCLEALWTILAAGNEVLIVSKPHIACVRGLWEEFRGLCHPITLRPLITFRFTIGMLDDRIRWFWEPNAPTVEERLEALALAHEESFATSVSCEPLLEPERAAELVRTVEPYVTDTVWIGAANHLRRRTAWVPNAEALGLEREIRRLEAWQTPQIVQRVYDALKDDPKVRWKDSYREALGLGEGEVG
jgi:DNA repair photolyase